MLICFYFEKFQTHIETPTTEPIRSDYEDELADGDQPDYNSQDEAEVIPESTNGAPLLPRHDDETEEDKPSNYQIILLYTFSESVEQLTFNNVNPLVWKYE